MRAHRIALLAFIAALPLVVLACAPSPTLTSDLPMIGMEGAREIPIEALAGAPSGLSGETVRTSGRVVSTGRDPAGVWIDLTAVGPADRANAAGSASSGTASPVRLLLPKGDDAETIASYQGRVATLALTVQGPVKLADGKPALSVTPLQYSARFAEAAAPSAEVAQLDREINQAAAQVSRDIDASTTRFFASPDYTDGASESNVRVRFLDPRLDRPRWSVDGPVSIQRSGSAAAPDYRYRAIARSAAGETRTSTCVFAVRDGKLRSVSYDEVVRDRSEKVVEQRQLDFSGTYLDPLTGERSRWPENIYPAPCLGLVLAGFPFASKKIVHFYAWTDVEPAAPMSAMVDGIERVTVPAGTFDAYRVRMRFDEERFVARLKLPQETGRQMARSMMEQLRLPNSVFWVTAREPQMIVRMEGPLGPPGITRGVIELTELPRGTERTLADASR